MGRLVPYSQPGDRRSSRIATDASPTARFKVRTDVIAHGCVRGSVRMSRCEKGFARTHWRHHIVRHLLVILLIYVATGKRKSLCLYETLGAARLKNA